MILQMRSLRSEVEQTKDDSCKKVKKLEESIRCVYIYIVYPFIGSMFNAVRILVYRFHKGSRNLLITEPVCEVLYNTYFLVTLFFKPPAWKVRRGIK